MMLKEINNINYQNYLDYYLGYYSISLWNKIQYMNRNIKNVINRYKYDGYYTEY